MVVVGEAATAHEGVKRVAFDEPDIVVLDVRLPDASGVEACRHIRERFPHVRVLILTSFADEQAILGAVVGGASGFLLKKVGGSELIDGLRLVAAGESLINSEEAKRILANVQRGPRTDPRIATLSQREFEVLQLVTQGLTNKEIAERTYLSEKAVKNYVSNMLAKMGFHRRVEAATHLARQEAKFETDQEAWSSSD